MTLAPLSAAAALDAYYLEARSKLLDLAAILDRIDRGRLPSEVAADPRLARLNEALSILKQTKPKRAERVQTLFSLDYDPDWKRPSPR